MTEREFALAAQQEVARLERLKPRPFVGDRLVVVRLSEVLDRLRKPA